MTAKRKLKHILVACTLSLACGESDANNVGDAGVSADMAAPCSRDADCDNGLFCDGVETCDLPSGACVAGTAPAIDDGITCTSDSCDEAADQVVHDPDATVCDDQLACNGAERCVVGVGCEAGTPLAASDLDADGVTVGEGDCDDCDPLVRPGSLDLAGNSLDDDCDGTTDEAAAGACDGSLTTGDTTAAAAAQALGLCAAATQPLQHGVISAAYVRADGTAHSPGVEVGLLDQFGLALTALEGARLLALSSGIARDPASGGCGTTSCSSTGAGSAPAGFPAAIAGCPTASDIFDDVGLEVTVRVPANATGFEFSSFYASAEFPVAVCALGGFGDQAIVLMNPPPQGAADGNVLIDAGGLPISHASAFITHCDPASQSNYAMGCSQASCPAAPVPYCQHGNGVLANTGFDSRDAPNGGATGWLTTRVPAAPGTEVALRFVVYDMYDSGGDATLLVDDFRWLTAPGLTLSTAPRL